MGVCNHKGREAYAFFSVDLFAEPPMDYAGLFERSRLIAALGTTVRVCSLEDLIAMKQAARRPQDLLDCGGPKEDSGAESWIGVRWAVTNGL